MKILLVTEYFPPFAPGGTPWSILYMARALSQAGHHVQILTPNYGAASQEPQDGFSVIRYPFWKRLFPGHGIAKIWTFVNPLFHVYSAWVLYREAKRFKPDVIHVQEKHSFPFSVFVARCLKIPVYITLRDYGLLCPITTCLLSHSNVPSDCGISKMQNECAPFFHENYVTSGSQKGLWKTKLKLQMLFADVRWKRRLLQKATGVFGVSQAILDIYARAIPIAQKREVLHNLPPDDTLPVENLPTLTPLQHKTVVLYVGKLSLGKGFPMFLETARHLKARHPETVFAVAGQAAKSWDNVPDNMVFLGHLDKAHLAAAYVASRAVVIPALWPEPYSRIPLEAASFSRACIASRKGGTAEFIAHGTNGILFSPGNQAELDSAVSEMLSNPIKAKQLGEAAHASVQNEMSRTQWVADYLKIIQC